MEAALTLTEILAIVMFGEAGILHDDAAAMAVGHVFMNRYNHDSGSFGDTPLEVAKGFHAFKVTYLDDVPHRYLELAGLLVNFALYDPTKGSLYIISYQDTYTFADNNGEALWIRGSSDWKSKPRIISGELYILYAYKVFPGDIKIPAELVRMSK